MNKWKYALSSADEAPDTAPILLKGSICDNLKTASNLGYQAIEVHMRENDPLNIQQVTDAMDKYNIRIAQIITGRLNTEGHCSLISDEPYNEKAAMDGMLQYIDIASKLKADIVIGWIKGNVPAGKTREKYLRRLAGNLEILNEYGKEKHVKLNIEVINHYEVNIFTTALELLTFLDQYKLDNCYVHLDTFHMNIEESDIVGAIKASKGRLGYFHIADNQRWYPGSGMLDFTSIFNALKIIGYDGYISVECFPHGDGEETARKAIDFLKSLQ